MSGFPIHSNVSLHVKPGSFGAKVDEFGLHLPVEMYILARFIGWPDAEQFFLGTLDFPEIFQGDEFGWNADQCRQASDELRELLCNFLPDVVLNPLEIKQYSTGALPPGETVPVSPQPSSVPVANKLIDESVNRAFGEVVSEVRIFALRQNVDEVKHKTTISRLVARAKVFITGQSGHEVDLAGVDLQELGELEEVSPPLHPSQDELLVSIQRLASAWNATIEGEFVLLTVAKPVRSGK